MEKCAVLTCTNTADPRWYACDVNGRAVMICDGHDPMPSVSEVAVRPNPIDTFVEVVSTALADAKRQLSAEAYYNTLLLAQSVIAAGLAAWREENPP